MFLVIIRSTQHERTPDHGKHPLNGVLLKNPNCKDIYLKWASLTRGFPFYEIFILSTRYLFFLPCLPSGLGMEGLSKKRLIVCPNLALCLCLDENWFSSKRDLPLYEIFILSTRYLFFLSCLPSELGMEGLSKKRLIVCPNLALCLCLDENWFYSPGKRLWSVLIATLLTFFRFRTKLRLVLSVENVYRIGLREELSGRTNTAIHT